MKMLIKIAVCSLMLFVAAPVAADSSPAADKTQGGAIDQPDDVADRQLERARLLLSSHHQLPERETFEEQLEDPRATLISIARDTDQLSLYRRQALDALGYWADQEVAKLYVDLLDDDQTPGNVEHRLMLLLADHFEDEALTHLEPYLSDDDLQLRLTAIEAIGRIDTEEADTALKDAREDEQHDIALKRYQRALR